MPAGDQGIIATRAYDVLSVHTPLVGQYSLVSTVTGHLTYSPGPMLYWLIALPARFGSPQTIALTMGLANVLAVLGIVALARRRGGAVLMLAVALATALMCRSFMSEALHDPWNPSAGLLPFALLVFLCWSLACGDHRLLPIVALVGSFAAQCQLAFLAPTVGLLAIGSIGLAVSRRMGRAKGRLWPWALAAAGVLAVCWTPPLIDQIEHSPGNLKLLYRAATVQTNTMGTTAGARAVIRAVGITPRWLRPPGDPFDDRLGDVSSAPGALLTGSCVALLAALLAAALAGVWRRRLDIVSAAAIGLWLCVALAAVAAGTPVSSFKVLGYTLWWGSVAGMWVWLILAFCAVTLAREGIAWRREGISPRRSHPQRSQPQLSDSQRSHPQSSHPQRSHPQPSPPGPRRGSVLAGVLGLGAALAVGSAVAAGQPPDAHRPEYAPIASIASQLRAAKIPRASTVWLRSSLGGVASPLSQSVKFLLRREGLRVLQYGATARLGPWYEIDHRRYDYTVYAYDRTVPHDRRARVIARVRMTESGRPRPIVVSLAPAGERGGLGPRRLATFSR